MKNARYKLEGGLIGLPQLKGGAQGGGGGSGMFHSTVSHRVLRSYDKFLTEA